MRYLLDGWSGEHWDVARVRLLEGLHLVPLRHSPLAPGVFAPGTSSALGPWRSFVVVPPRFEPMLPGLRTMVDSGSAVFGLLCNPVLQSALNITALGLPALRELFGYILPPAWRGRDCLGAQQGRGNLRDMEHCAVLAPEPELEDDSVAARAQEEAVERGGFLGELCQ